MHLLVRGTVLVECEDLQALLLVELRVAQNAEEQLAHLGARGRALRGSEVRPAQLDDVVGPRVDVVHGPDPDGSLVGELGHRAAPRPTSDDAVGVLVVLDDVHVQHHHVPRVLLQVIPRAEEDVQALLPLRRGLLREVLCVEAASRHREAIQVTGPHLQDDPPAERLVGLGRRREVTVGCQFIVVDLQQVQHVDPFPVEKTGLNRDDDLHLALRLLVAGDVAAGLPRDNHRGPSAFVCLGHDGREAQLGHRHLDGIAHYQRARLPDVAVRVPQVMVLRHGAPADDVAAPVRRGEAPLHLETIEALLGVPLPGHRVDAERRELCRGVPHPDHDLEALGHRIVAGHEDLVRRAVGLVHGRGPAVCALDFDVVAVLQPMGPREADPRAHRVPDHGRDPRVQGGTVQEGRQLVGAVPVRVLVGHVHVAAVRQVIVVAEDQDPVVGIQGVAYDIQVERHACIHGPGLAHVGAGHQRAPEDGPVGDLVAVGVAVAHRVPAGLGDADVGDAVLPLTVADLAVALARGLRRVAVVERLGVGVVRVPGLELMPRHGVRLGLVEAGVLVDVPGGVREDLHLARHGARGAPVPRLRRQLAAHLHVGPRVHNERADAEAVEVLVRELHPHGPDLEEPGLEPVHAVQAVAVAVADVEVGRDHDSVVVRCVDLNLVPGRILRPQRLGHVPAGDGVDAIRRAHVAAECPLAVDCGRRLRKELAATRRIVVGEVCLKGLAHDLVAHLIVRFAAARGQIVANAQRPRGAAVDDQVESDRGIDRHALLARQDGDRDEAANLLREVQCRVVWQRPVAGAVEIVVAEADAVADFPRVEGLADVIPGEDQAQIVNLEARLVVDLRVVALIVVGGERSVGELPVAASLVHIHELDPPRRREVRVRETNLHEIADAASRTSELVA
mmetsp:Transcript_37356/g.110829  ORF Transcript_37356/g.110829 Transcript_37356/m.110829 type:complete len:902 (-) Transcript_37356:682-3387(-)